MRRQLARQITAPVNFAGSIERLYAEGIRLFVEVGPGSVLSSLTRSIVGDREAIVLASDSKRAGASGPFEALLCGLFAAGVEFDLSVPMASGAEAPVVADRPSPVMAESECMGPPRTDGLQVVYSGVSVGLPGSFKQAFRDDNFEQLFEGRI